MLLHVDHAAGHGFGSLMDQRLVQTADMAGFAMRQTGDLDSRSEKIAKH
jgi:hypothetical protein